MWFNKKEKEEVKDQFADKVKCEDCKHWVDKSECQEVENEHRDFDFYANGKRDYFYYCPMHKKPYDSIYKIVTIWNYYKKMEVDENGEPIGYQKIAPRKQKRG